MFDIETFNFELFKECAEFYKQECGLMLRSHEEQILFKRYLDNHGIKYSGFGFKKHSFGTVALMWNESACSVWGYDGDACGNMELVNLEYFCKRAFSFASSEEDLFNFLNR